MHIVYMHEQSSLYTHTLTRSLSDDPGFARPDIGRFISIVWCLVRPYILREAWVSLSDSGILISLSFLLFPYSWYIGFSCYSTFSFIWYHAWMLICDIAVIMFHYSFDLYLVQVTLGLACMRGVFPPVYTSPTRVASPLQRILGSGAWH